MLCHFALALLPFASGLGIKIEHDDPEEFDSDEHSSNSGSYNLTEWLEITGQSNTHEMTNFFGVEEEADDRGSKFDNICIDGRLAPEFFLLGISKAATTTFAAGLFRIPGIRAYSKRWGDLPYFDKEPHIFDDVFKTRFEKLVPQKWLQAYPKCSKHQRIVATDCTPSYLSTPGTARRIADQYSPEMRKKLKFMVLLRDPVTRAQSEYSFEAAGHGDNKARRFDKYKKMGFPKYLQEHVFAEGIAEKEWDPLNVVRHSEYVPMLKEYFKVFEPSQFLVVPMKLNTNGGHDLLNFVADKLKLPHLGALPPVHANQGKHKNVAEELGADGLEKVREALHERFSAQTVAQVLANSGAQLYGYQPRDGNVSQWLATNW